MIGTNHTIHNDDYEYLSDRHFFAEQLICMMRRTIKIHISIRYVIVPDRPLSYTYLRLIIISELYSVV